MEARPLPPTHLALPMDQLQQIADYLQRQPWNQVDGMLQNLKAAQPVNLVQPQEPPGNEQQQQGGE